MADFPPPWYMPSLYTTVGVPGLYTRLFDTGLLVLAVPDSAVMCSFDRRVKEARLYTQNLSERSIMRDSCQKGLLHGAIP